MAKKEFKLDLDEKPVVVSTIPDADFVAGGIDPFTEKTSIMATPTKPASHPVKTKSARVPAAKVEGKRILKSIAWTRKVIWIDEAALEKLQKMADKTQGRRTGRGNTSKLIRELIEQATN